MCNVGRLQDINHHLLVDIHYVWRVSNGPYTSRTKQYKSGLNNTNITNNLFDLIFPLLPYLATEVYEASIQKIPW